MKKMLNSPVLVVLLLVSGGVASAFSKWYLVWLAQRLGGAELLGAYGTVLAFATPIFVVGQLGLRTLLLSLVEVFPWKTFVILRAVGLFLSSLMLLLYVSISVDIPISFGLSILALKVADSVLDLDLARIQWGGQLKKVATISLVGAPISMLLATLFAIVTSSIEWAIWGAAIGSSVMAIVSWSIARRVDFVPTASRKGFKEILSAAVPVTGAQLLAALLLYLPVLMLSNKSSLEVVGVYTGTAYILTAADLVGSSISKLLITRFRTIKEKFGSAELIRTARKTTAQFFLLGTACSIPVVLWGGSIFEFIYGPEFRISYFNLILYSAAAVFIILAFIQSVTLNVLNSYYRVAVAYGFACLGAFAVGFGISWTPVEPLTVGVIMATAGAFIRYLVLRSATSPSRKEASRNSK